MATMTTQDKFILKEFDILNEQLNGFTGRIQTIHINRDKWKGAEREKKFEKYIATAKKFINELDKIKMI